MAISMPVPRRARDDAERGPIAIARPELAGLLALAATLYLWGLSRNAFANRYYSAAVRSMSTSWHAFLYGSFDASGVMTVDKPPLALWIQALSVREFGFNPWSILVPQALMGVATVALVYDLVRRVFGRAAGFVAGLALVFTPITVAISRHNNPDALLVLCCAGAVWALVRAFEDGRTRWVVLAGLAVGLGFETKMGAALLVVPAIAAAWLWVAPRGRLVAVGQLLAGGVVMAVVGLAWPVLMWLTPAADRPWISGTADNSIWSLIVGYNGLGRVFGQAGAPHARAHRLAHHARAVHGHSLAFGGRPGPLRLLNAVLGGQAGWLLGVAVVGGLVLLAVSRLRRADPRTGWLVLVGGAFLTIAVAFSRAQGIFHPYYVSLLAPFTAALVGAATGLILGRGPVARVAGPAAVAAGVIAEVVVLRGDPATLRWWEPLLPAAGAAVAVVLAFALAPLARVLVVAAAVAVLGLAPAVWAAETLPHATGGTFPAGGPVTIVAKRGFGGRPLSLGALRHVLATREASLMKALRYVKRHGGGTIAVGSQSAAAGPIITRGAHVAGIGGFSGRESQVTDAWLAGVVRSGRVRYVLASRRATIVGRYGRIGAADVLGTVELVGRPVRAVPGLYDLRGRAHLLTPGVPSGVL